MDLRLLLARRDMAFQLFLARTMGLQAQYTEDGVVHEGYIWRGIFFLTRTYRETK